MTEKEQGKTTSKIAGEINAEMMKTTRATQSLTDRMVQEIESLRQQLASCDAEIERLKTVPMRYRRMAFNAQLQNENTQLCQQLAAALAAIKLKDALFEKIACLGNGDIHGNSFGNDLGKEGLAIQPDDAALKAWLGEPVARLIPVALPDGYRVWARTFEEYSQESSEKNMYRNGPEIPLYKSKELK